jgi:hypothetical protein
VCVARSLIHLETGTLSGRDRREHGRNGKRGKKNGNKNSWKARHAENKGRVLLKCRKMRKKEEPKKKKGPCKVHKERTPTVHAPCKVGTQEHEKKEQSLKRE